MLLLLFWSTRVENTSAQCDRSQDFSQYPKQAQRNTREMKFILFTTGHATESKLQSGILLVLQGSKVYYHPIFATELTSPRIDSARFIENLAETPPECTFPLLGTREGRTSVMEGLMCMNGPNGQTPE